LTEGHQSEIAAAISADFGHRSRHETVLAEIFMVVAAIGHARRDLPAWVKPRRVPTPLYLWPAYSRVYSQPLGVVGIISPWNYPFQLAIGPAIGALAAGNRVMIKPSELTPRLSELLAVMISKDFAADEMAVVTGDADVGSDFSALPFDHLLFTGSTAVGRKVALAAAQNLTPVTLELGGKSPAVIDRTCDLAAAGKSIAVGKLFNAGQTCIAPDYVLVPSTMRDELIASITHAVTQLYPSLTGNPDYSGIAGSRHFQRLSAMVEDARSKGAGVVTVNPGSGSPEDMAPRFPLVLINGATEDMRVMQEEIFGPILPLVTYTGIDEAIAFISARAHPLALYWFGTDVTRRNRILEYTVSGGVTVNDTLLHFCQENLPFGGVGASGMGAYHGEHGYRTFSKEKAVFFQRRVNGTWLLHPPYGPRFESVMRLLRKLS
jgi:coniferyl-aldehyde dehydrogenase